MDCGFHTKTTVLRSSANTVLKFNRRSNTGATPNPPGHLVPHFRAALRCATQVHAAPGNWGSEAPTWSRRTGPRAHPRRVPAATGFTAKPRRSSNPLMHAAGTASSRPVRRHAIPAKMKWSVSKSRNTSANIPSNTALPMVRMAPPTQGLTAAGNQLCARTPSPSSTPGLRESKR